MATTFNVQEFLASQNLQLKTTRDGVFAEGVDETGQPFEFSPRQYLIAQGIDPTNVDIQWNTPNQALPESPTTIADRAFLSLGNPRGQVKWLKQKFDDAGYTAKNGLVVKDKGVWKQVDPSLLNGDGWEISEALKDVADLTGDVPVVGGAAGGAIVSAPSGPAALGGAAAGAGAGETLRTSLGRLVGTYDASPGEQLADIGIEAALGLGGETIGLGLKAVAKSQIAKQMGKTFRFVKQEADDAAKGIYTNAVGTLTGVGSEAAEWAAENPEELSRTITKLIKTGDTSRDIAAKLAPLQQRRAQQFLDGAADALPAKYGELLDETINLAEARGMQVNVGEVVEKSMKALEREGLGRLETTKAGKLILRPFSPAEIAERLGNVETLAPADFKAINEVLGSLNQFSRIGVQRGAAAARTLANINRSVNQSFKRFQREPSLQRIGAVATSEFKNGVNEAFNKAGLSAQWARGAQLYSEFSEAVNAARRISQSDQGTGLFIDRLLKDSGAGKNARGMSARLLELNPSLKPIYDNLIRDEASVRFVSWLPREGLISRQGAAAGAGALYFMDPSAGIGILASTSPRVAGNVTAVIPYGFQLVDFAKNLGPRQAAQLLKNPAALRAAFQLTAGAAAEEQQAVGEIVTSALQ